MKDEDVPKLVEFRMLKQGVNLVRLKEYLISLARTEEKQEPDPVSRMADY